MGRARDGADAWGRPVVVLDPGGRILLTNEAFERLLGTTHPHLQGAQDLPAFFADPALVRRSLRELLSQRRTWRGEVSLGTIARRGDPLRYHEANESFHGAIYAGTHNSYLAEITAMTRLRVAPFRRAQFRNLGRLAKSHAEHDRVVLAILRGDKTGAAAAMRAHIELVRGEYEIYAVSV